MRVQMIRAGQSLTSRTKVRVRVAIPHSRARRLMAVRSALNIDLAPTLLDLAGAEVVWTSSKEVAEQIGEYLGHNDPWRPTVDGNWTVGPAVVAEREVTAQDG